VWLHAVANGTHRTIRALARSRRLHADFRQRLRHCFQAAIKILPESFASDPDRLARETEILASLQSNSHRYCSTQV
jgi:hypothetical protein